ncbi:GntR family transcriptional regulator [Streptomyces sp. NPDC006012]|uniref:GntR family transcriptional regulator n=1 Tax=Streptomyces sp. NPDC006012 TaxID=3364739 RepID=UPI003680D290
MEAEAIKVSTVHHEVYDRLRRWISSGSLPPGTKVSIRSIADSFGVSTMPVREALRRLQAEGFVLFERRSVTVTDLSKDQVTQLFKIRLRLEQLASEWAIGQVNDDDIADLERILQRMNQDGIGVEEWRGLNQDFHRRFYDCARSPHLLDLIKNVWDKIEPYMAVYASTVEDFHEAHKQHTEILELIRSGDLPRLLTATERHLEDTAAIVLQAL